jgi:HSP20 family protein
MSLLKHKHRHRTAEVAGAEDGPRRRIPTWTLLDELFPDVDGRHLIKVEEFTEKGAMVVRAELAGIDPERDVEITIQDGMLCVAAGRTENEDTEDRDFHRRELRYGSFARCIPLPEGVAETSVAASYKDGILEVRVPLPAEPPKEPARRIAVTRQ